MSLGISICQNYNISGTELFYKWEAKRFGSGRSFASVAAEALTLEGVEDLKKGMIEELNKKRPRGQNTQSRKVDMMAMMRRGQQNNSKSMKAASSGTSLNGGAKNVGLKVTYKGPAEDKSKRKCTLSFHSLLLEIQK